MNAKRIRLASVTVQLNVYIDDGENLEHAQVQPVTIAASEWSSFSATGVQDAVAGIQTQLEQQPEAGSDNE